MAMGRRVEGTEHITDSWQTARQVKNALAYLGWNHVAYSEDLQGSHRFETDMTVVEHFAEAVSGKKEDAAAELLNNFAQELEEKQIFLNGEIRHVYSREQRAKWLLADIWRLPRGSNTPLLCSAASLIPRCLQRGL